MNLVDDWKIIAKRAWSMRLAILSAGFGLMEVALPYFTTMVPPKTMAILAAFAACGSAISRIVAQPEMRK